MFLNIQDDRRVLGELRETALQVVFLGQGFSHGANDLLNAETAVRFRDLWAAGGAVMSRVGWWYRGWPCCVAAVEPQTRKVVAASWAGPIRYADSSRGVNLAYAVAPDWEGRGIVRTLVAAAVWCLDDRGYAPEPAGAVNIQCRADNVRAAQIAHAFGFEPCPERSFLVPRPEQPEGEAYCAFTKSWADLVADCQGLLAQRFQPLEQFQAKDVVSMGAAPWASTTLRRDRMRAGG